MLKTDNYELNIAQGTDIVNPLVMDNPNYQKIDKVLKDNEIRGIGTATELKTGSIHAITVPAQYTTFKFVATSDFVTGDTFTLNGKQVTGYTTNQQPLTTNAYRIGATVLCSYIEQTSTITLYTISLAGKAEDSDKLEGHPASYFAVRGNTNQTLEAVNSTATARGTLAQTANDLANRALNGIFKNYVFNFDYNTTIKFSGTGLTRCVIGLILVSGQSSCTEPISISLTGDGDTQAYGGQSIFVSNNTYGIEGRANCELFVPANIGNRYGNIRVILFEPNVTCSAL
jgi:hypothetical protein